jgi:hypothetical protein
MGGHYIDYFVPYQPDINQALRDLQQQILDEGDFPWLEEHRARPKTVVEYEEFREWLQRAFLSDVDDEENDEIMYAFEGFETYTALDMEGISETPFAARLCPLSEDELDVYFDTHEPTKEQIQANYDFTEIIERGYGIYTIAYQNGKPSEIYFGFYSND